MSHSKSPVWVIAEQTNGKVPPVCLELLGKARELADELGVLAEIILFGEVSEDQREQLLHSGADVIYYCDSLDFEIYQPEIYAETVFRQTKESQPQIMLLGSTFIGRELAPVIAAKLETGLTAHCIDLVLNQEGILEQIIPAYGGLITIICPEKRPQMATVAQGVFPSPEVDTGRSGNIIKIEPPQEITTRVKTLEIVRKEPEGVPLEEAPIVVAGGAGAGSLEGWQEITDLAKTLNAALGSTRPVVDEGWMDLETMIGQSGKMVSPDLYIGVGLSGEQQHMVGISGAKVMVAINNDPKSPVFDQVDLGIVEDCSEFIPVFIKKLKEFGTNSA